MILSENTGIIHGHHHDKVFQAEIPVSVRLVETSSPRKTLFQFLVDSSAWMPITNWPMKSSIKEEGNMGGIVLFLTLLVLGWVYVLAGKVVAIAAAILVPISIAIAAKQKMGKLDKGAIAVIVWISLIFVVIAFFIYDM